MITIHETVTQGDDAWHDLRRGILCASEVRLILTVSGGNATTQYRATGKPLTKSTPARQKALDAIGAREGSVKDLSIIADVSDGVIRALITDGAIESFTTIAPLSFKASDDDRTKQHVWEIAAQRISGHTEPTYIGDAMLRGHEDEIRARDLYSERYAPVQEVGFITNDSLGFRIGYSPDGLVGDDGLIECKSRIQKYQVQTIVEMIPPDDFILQLQTGLLVSGREWLDFISYSGGLPMVTMRVEPDERYQRAIKEAATVFENKVQEVVTRYGERLADDANRLVPTERKIEQEMFIGGEE